MHTNVGTYIYTQWSRSEKIICKDLQVEFQAGLICRWKTECVPDLTAVFVSLPSFVWCQAHSGVPSLISEHQTSADLGSTVQDRTEQSQLLLTTLADIKTRLTKMLPCPVVPAAHCTTFNPAPGGLLCCAWDCCHVILWYYKCLVLGSVWTQFYQAHQLYLTPARPLNSSNCLHFHQWVFLGRPQGFNMDRILWSCIIVFLLVF